MHHLALLVGRLAFVAVVAQNPEEEVEWFYVDLQGKTQGPFGSQKMKSWKDDNLVPADLPVRRGSEGSCCKLSSVDLLAASPRCHTNNHTHIVPTATTGSGSLPSGDIVSITVMVDGKEEQVQWAQ